MRKKKVFKKEAWVKTVISERAQCAQMLKFGNKFNNLTQSNHRRLIECLLEVEFNYL